VNELPLAAMFRCVVSSGIAVIIVKTYSKDNIIRYMENVSFFSSFHEYSGCYILLVIVWIQIKYWLKAGWIYTCIHCFMQTN